MVAPSALRGAWRGARATVRSASAELRALPDFLVIGTMKGGTSSLYADLAQLPGVRPAAMKEPQFLAGYRSHRSLRWYRSQFPLRGIRGDATPYVMFHPRGAERAASLTPAARCIVVLRDPVARAWSHWAHQVRRGREALSFADALAAEDERVAEAHDRLAAGDQREEAAHQFFSYRRRGEYAEQLARWFEHFPRDRVLVLESEEYFEQPHEVITEVAAFLGVECSAIAPSMVNIGDRREPPHPSITDMLRDHYRPHNEALERVVGRTFRWASGATG